MDGQTDRDYRNARRNILHPYREQRQIAKVVGSKIFHLANAKKAAITVICRPLQCYNITYQTYTSH